MWENTDQKTPNTDNFYAVYTSDWRRQLVGNNHIFMVFNIIIFKSYIRIKQKPIADVWQGP